MKISDQIGTVLKALALVLIKLLKSGKNYIILISIGHSKIKEVRYLEENKLENIYKYGDNNGKAF